jgi:hypothetical protein
MSAHDYYTHGIIRAEPEMECKSWWNPFSWWPSDDVPSEADVEQAVSAIADEGRDAEGFQTEAAIREAGERTKQPILQMIADLEQQLQEAVGGSERATIRDQIRRAQERLGFIDTLTAKRLAMRGRSAG